MPLPFWVYWGCQLVDDVETCVFLEHFRHLDTFRSLVVFEQSCHDAWECQCRAVEGVAEVSFLVVATIAALQAVGLVSLEVRYRAHLKPAFLCATPHLKVESDG